MLSLNIENDGIALREELVPKDLLQSAIQEVEALDEAMPAYGIRNAEKKFPSFLEIAQYQTVQNEARRILGGNPKIVRVIFFDKTPTKNWLVTWHQDRTVAVSKKFDLDGWKTWTLKDQTHHVQPPLDVLNNMVTFRIHLDAADKDNGCLKVIPKSHQFGLLTQKEIYDITAKQASVLCEVKAGDTVVMRPHLLHSSSKSATPKHRRVIHIEFSVFELPNGASWV